jgi:hypothetical protein
MTLVERARPYVILLLFALVGIGWRTPGATGAGTLRYFHVPMLLILVLAVGRYAMLKRIEGLSIVIVLYTVVYMAFSWYNGVGPLALQQGVYLGAGFMVAASLRVATPRDWRILRWTGPVAVLLFVVVFFQDAAAVGISVVGTYKVALTSGNLDLIQFGLFQPVFNAHTAPGEIPNNAALRGIVIAGILVSMYLSMYARRMVDQKARLYSVVYWGSMVATALIVVLTLARFLQIVLFLAVLMALARLILRNRARAGVMAVTVTGLAAIVIAFVTPVAGLVYSRFTQDTGSYNERGSALRFAIDSIFRSPWTGANTGGDAAALATGDRTTLSAHNFVLDATVVGGVITGILALIVMLWIFRDIARGVTAFLLDDRLLAPVAAALLAPVVMFTEGSGTLDMASILGLALFYGVYVGHRNERAPTPEGAEAHAGVPDDPVLAPSLI